MATELGPNQSADWSRVREAITERWPQINRDELADCADNMAELKQFVKHRVDSSDDEVDEYLNEYAPPRSYTERAGVAVRSAYRAADECIAERPTESVVTSFIAGVLVGVTVTALLMNRSRSHLTGWDRIKQQSWR